MKIVDRDELMTMPNGTLFCEFNQQGYIGPLRIFRYKTEIDFYSTPIYPALNSNSENSEEAMFDAMLANGAEYPIFIDDEERDGCYAYNQLYFVYSGNDKQKIIDFLLTTFE